MPNKKEPLLIIAVKTLLAVIIFAGVGTIIIGGGWLIGEQEMVLNNELSKSKSVVEKTNEMASENEITELSEQQSFEKDFIFTSIKTKVTSDIKEDSATIWMCYLDQNGKLIHDAKVALVLDSSLTSHKNLISHKDYNYEVKFSEENGYYVTFYYTSLFKGPYYFKMKAEKEGYVSRHKELKLELSEDNANLRSLETLNWETYQNEKYGFEMKYPEDWKLTEDRDLEGRDESVFEKEIVFISPLTECISRCNSRYEERINFEVTLVVYEKSKWDKIVPSLHEGKINNLGYKEITLENDISAITWSSVTPVAEHVIIAIKKDQNFILIRGVFKTSPWEIKGFNQILSTFKFIE